MKSLEELFPYSYSSVGYFRKTGVPKGEVAEMLHGYQAIEFLYDEICKEINNDKELKNHE